MAAVARRRSESVSGAQNLLIPARAKGQQVISSSFSSSCLPSLLFVSFHFTCFSLRCFSVIVSHLSLHCFISYTFLFPLLFSFLILFPGATPFLLSFLFLFFPSLFSSPLPSLFSKPSPSSFHHNYFLFSFVSLLSHPLLLGFFSSSLLCLVVFSSSSSCISDLLLTKLCSR